MFSPEGYLSLKDVENRAKGLNIPGLTSAVFHERLSNLPGLFAASSSGVVTRISLGVLAVGNDGQYAFLNRGTWAIDLKCIRDLSGENDLGVGVWLLAYELKAKDVDPLWRLVEDGFADLLVSFEGQALVMIEDDAEKLLKELEGLVAPPTPEERARPMSRAEASRQWEDWVGSFDPADKPTVAQREAWGRARGISRERIRELTRDSAPAHWSAPGAPKKLQ